MDSLDALYATPIPREGVISLKHSCVSVSRTTQTLRWRGTTRAATARSPSASRNIASASKPPFSALRTASASTARTMRWAPHSKARLQSLQTSLGWVVSNSGCAPRLCWSGYALMGPQGSGSGLLDEGWVGHVHQSMKLCVSRLTHKGVGGDASCSTVQKAYVTFQFPHMGVFISKVPESRRFHFPEACPNRFGRIGFKVHPTDELIRAVPRHVSHAMLCCERGPT